MPVLEEEGPRARGGGGRRWLSPFLAAPVLLILLLLLVPLTRPVTLEIGGQFFLIDTVWLPSRAAGGPTLGGHDVAAVGQDVLVMETDGRGWQAVTGPVRERSLHLGRCVYTVRWFRGTKIPPVR